jgi:hypothetical protein
MTQLCSYLLALTTVLTLQPRHILAMSTGAPANETTLPNRDFIAERAFFATLPDPDAIVTERGLAPSLLGNSTWSASSLGRRAVWNPKITSPTAGEVWVAGSTAKITWYLASHYSAPFNLLIDLLRDTTSASRDITNSQGKILLGHLDNGTDEHLDVGACNLRAFSREGVSAD